MKQPTILKTAAIALVVAFIGTLWVRGRFGNESVICDTGACELGSGMTWLLSGVTILGPFFALAGFFWSRSLHQKSQLGPFNTRAIPDGEQIGEIMLVVFGVLVSYWLILNGPSIEFGSAPQDPTLADRPNQFAQWLREFRAPDALTADDRARLDEVPSRRTWFLVGTFLGAPFALSFGAMLGREWYGRKRRKAQQLEDELGSEVIELTSLESASGRSTADIDLSEVESSTTESD